LPYFHRKLETEQLVLMEPERHYVTKISSSIS
jgi:hypothetical protein